ncbi:HAD family hydrolase [Limosilactobacillus ingluviei]|uniref:HAD family hydrolase n=1 Tax=Limosilactobacillus ingluviei TaxID=148604 RepID=UPI0030B891BD
MGDDLNDLPLLKAVGHPLAVANAQPAVRACAGQILASNQADGVAHFLAQS